MKALQQESAKNAIPYGSNGSTLTRGGTPLDEEGKVRMYNAGQSLANDFSDSNNKVGLGQYLRAVVDKPRNAAEREILHNSVSSGDYELPTHIAAELIDSLRANNPLLMSNGAGSRVVTLEGGDTKWIRIDSDMSATHHAEMNSETPDDPLFGSITLAPKTLLAMTEI